MPRMDGFEATKRIRDHVQRFQRAMQDNTNQGENEPLSLPSPKIIAITASVFTDKKEAILPLGFDGYVIKPFKESVIWDILTECLNVQFLYAHTETNRKEESDTPETEWTDERIVETLKAIMTPEWIAELHQAASQLKRRRVMRLLEDLPDNHEAIAQHLSALADAYQFEQIADLLTS